MKTILIGIALAAVGCVPNPSDVSVDSVTCAKGGNYQSYESPNGNYFKTSDGQTFKCVSPDCARANEDVNAWCAAH